MICLVTDRRVFASDAGDNDAAIAGMLAVIAACAAAGVDLVQIRETGLTDRQLLAMTEQAVARTDGTGTRIVVNDRSDIALAAGAAGSHLKDDTRDPARIRTLAPPGWIVGRSVHDPDTARAAAASGAIDYLIAGTLFGSASKPGRVPLGLDGLRAIVAAAAPVPVLAIGGIDAANVARVARTGAAGIAAIRLFRTDQIARVVAAIRGAFTLP